VTAAEEKRETTIMIASSYYPPYTKGFREDTLKYRRNRAVSL
jgi:hypothetical protein